MDSSWKRGRYNPLLDGLEYQLHDGISSIVDGEVLLLPSCSGQGKVLTYRGGVVVAERELLPAKGGDVDELVVLIYYLHCQIEAMGNDALLATARDARNARFRLFDRFAAIEKELREVHRSA